MFKTSKELFVTNPTVGTMLATLVRWGAGIVIAAIEFQMIYTALLEWD